MTSTLPQQNELTALTPPPPPPSTSHHFILILNATLVVLGTGASLILRIYFLHGGCRLWLSSLLQVCSWPLLLIPILLSSLHHPCRRLLLLSPPVFAASSAIGLLFGIDCYLYSYGSSYLPLSTSSLLTSTQLSFTAFFSFLIVRQRFTAYSVNAIVLLTVGPVVLGLGANKDRPESESDEKYYLGFFMTVVASALIGLVLPLMERTYRMVKDGVVSYGVVMEVQLVIGVFGTGFCLVGMIINKDFQAIPKEAREFGLGEAKYYMILISDAIFWQFVNLGLVGVISCSSSFLAGILIAVLLPVSELLAVFFLREKFDGSKGVALALCLWGFVSYLYGEMKQSQKVKRMREVEVEMEQVPISIQ